MAAIAKPRFGSRRQPEESRAAILTAAMQEFSREGVAGARIDAIARQAGVNKALLYYYFRDKDALYAAVLDEVFGGLSAIVRPVFSLDLQPREKLLTYVQAHFDYVASHPLYPPIVQAEMMNAGRGRATQLPRIVRQYFQPLLGHLTEVLKAGHASGEFRHVEAMQFVPSMIAVIVFYFTNAPVMQILSGKDPLAPALVAARRTAVLDFISAALFQRPSQKIQGVCQ